MRSFWSRQERRWWKAENGCPMRRSATGWVRPGYDISLIVGFFWGPFVVFVERLECSTPRAPAYEMQAADQDGFPLPGTSKPLQMRAPAKAGCKS